MLWKKSGKRSNDEIDLFLPNVKSLAAALSGTYFSFFCSERVVTIDILVARFAPFFPAPHVR